MSPVRGHGWYKRPYRLRIEWPDGRITNKAFHWPGRWGEEKKWLYRAKRYGEVVNYKAWVADTEEGK